MAIVATSLPDVKPVTNTLAILKRSIGLTRAAQLLADASRCKQGLTPQPLKDLPRQDAIWYRQQAEQMIALFEQHVYEQEPPEALERAARERQAAILIARDLARARATRRGHDLSTFGPEAPDTFHEVASCQRCGRSVRIRVRCHPVLDVISEGDALADGCLIAAEEVE